MPMTPEQINQLEKLAKLKDSGVLSQEEVEAEKKKILEENKASSSSSKSEPIKIEKKETPKFILLLFNVLGWFYGLSAFIAAIASARSPFAALGLLINGLIVFPPFLAFLKKKNILIPTLVKLLIFIVGISIFGSSPPPKNTQVAQQAKKEPQLSKSEYLAKKKALIKDFKKSGTYTQCLVEINQVIEKYADQAPVLKETKDFCSKKQEAAVAEQLKKDKAEADKKARILRQTYAVTAREKFLDSGADIKVNVAGKNSDRIAFTFVLFSDVWAHKFQKEGIIDNLCAMGFKRIDMDSGYDWGKYWTCSE
jgi:hypothetical protein